MPAPALCWAVLREAEGWGQEALSPSQPPVAGCVHTLLLEHWEQPNQRCLVTLRCGVWPGLH